MTGVTAQTVTAAATTDVAVTGSTAIGATVINGGKNVTVTETGAAGGTVNIGATTAAAGTVTVNSTILATAGMTGNAITVKGGTDISITQKGANAVNTTVTDGAVVVTGTAATKTVTVVSDKAATAAATVVGHNNNSVSITDVNTSSATAAGTITSATVSNYTTLAFNGTALTTLNVKGGSGNIIIDNSGLTTPTNKTLGLTVDGLTGGTLDDADIYTTLNVTGTGSASTLANVTFGATTALNVDGSAAVTLTSVAGLSALTAVTSTNTAGLKLGSIIGNGVTFTGGAGDDAVVLGATTKAITMGAGNDKVTSAGLVGTGGSVDAGDGIDTIVMTFAQADAADANATFNSKFKNFEVLELDASAMGANGAVNLAGINGVNSVTTGAATNVLTLDNFASGGTLKLTSDAGAGSYVANVANAVFNSADMFNLNLSKSTVLAAGSVTATGVETLNITAADANTTTTSAAVKHTVTLDLAEATTVKVSGNNGLTITNTTGTKITTFDASGVVANSTATVIDAAANLGVTFISGNATTTANVSITGGAGDDVLTGNAAKDTIVGGAGNDTIDGKAGVDTLTGGAGVDTFVIGSGEAGITGAEKITDFNIALGGDKLDTAATILIANVTAANVTAAVGGAVDVTATVKDGIITVGGADAALVDSIGEIKAIFELLNADNADREAGAIVLNGQTYVLVDDATVGTGLTTDIIQLVGVTGAVSLSLTDAANSIFLA